MGWDKPLLELPPAPVTPKAWRWLLATLIFALLVVLAWLQWPEGLPGLFDGNEWGWVFALVTVIWVIVISVRWYLFGHAFNHHQLWQAETENIEREWQAWADRSLAVIASMSILPNDVSAAAIAQRVTITIERNNIIKFPAESSWQQQGAHGAIKILLHSIAENIAQLPLEIPLVVELISDTPLANSEELQQEVIQCWQHTFPNRKLSSCVIHQQLSLMLIQQLIKSASTAAHLLLVIQNQAESGHSDGLAALLMVVDDIAHNHQLPVKARLLRPMEIEKEHFTEEYRLFRNTQQAAQTAIGLLCPDNDPILQEGILIAPPEQWHTTLPVGNIYPLEYHLGILGQGAPWLTVALAIELSQLQSGNYLTLSRSDDNWAINSITTGRNK